MNYDVCIIGSGVVGAAIARELSKYDLNIALIEKGNDVALGCSKANSGIIHGGYDAKHGTYKARLNVAGNALYPQLNEQLNFGLDYPGSLVVAYSQNEVPVIQRIHDNGYANGLHDLSILSKQQILEKEPHINPDAKSALFCPSCGIVSPYELTIALAENAVSNGVHLLLSCEVKDIYKETKGFILKCTKSQLNSHQHMEIKSHIVINCAGVYSDVIAKMLDINYFRIIPRKGNYCVFARAYMPISHVLFQVPTQLGKGVLISPTYHGNLIIGPDAYETDNKNDTFPDKEKILQLQNTAKKTLPDLDIKKCIRQYAGIRPTAVHLDNSGKESRDFIIDSTSVENFICLAGIESPGLTAAPAIALQVAETVKKTYSQNNKILNAKTDFMPERRAFIKRQSERTFLPMKETAQRAELADGDKHKIICRCEEVLESTINLTFTLPFTPQSVDAIKRRTRAGMGICQGKFCKLRVKTILSKQLDIDVDSVSEK